VIKLDLYAMHHKSEEIPKTWSGENYDYFWIVDYADPASPRTDQSHRRQTDLHRALRERPG
jgi:hypothetical protein